MAAAPGGRALIYGPEPTKPVHPNLTRTLGQLLDARHKTQRQASSSLASCVAPNQPNLKDNGRTTQQLDKTTSEGVPCEMLALEMVT